MMLSRSDLQWNQWWNLAVSRITHEQNFVHFYCRWDLFIKKYPGLVYELYRLP